VRWLLHLWLRQAMTTQSTVLKVAASANTSAWLEQRTAIIVQMRDGRQIQCTTTLVYVGDKAGIVIYNKRSAINEDEASGWWPVSSNAELKGG
jgi:hypothetical protein